MKLDFKNKIVLITGGEGDLGKSICNKFLQLGAKVIVTTTKKELINRKTKKKIYMYLDFINQDTIQNFLNNFLHFHQIVLILYFFLLY